jgi:hypothetical protein
LNDEPYNAAERSHVKAAAKASRFADKARLETIRSIMDTVSGRAYMLGRLERCHIFASSFNTDPGLMAFAEGERNVGLQDLKDIMEACPDQYTLMMRESNDRSSAQSATRSPEPSSEPDSSTAELVE